MSAWAQKASIGGIRGGIRGHGGRWALAERSAERTGKTNVLVQALLESGRRGESSCQHLTRAPAPCAVQYIADYKWDVSKLEPLVAAPHSPDNRKTARECSDVKIDRVYIGSCTGEPRLRISLFFRGWAGRWMGRSARRCHGAGSLATDSH